MGDFVYSSGALNVLERFHRVDVVVHVEGEDDVVFWSQIFELFSELKAEFISVGSCSELDRRIALIESGAMRGIAARDCDYLRIREALSCHPRVLYTYGYSIENTLYCLTSIKSMLRVACKSHVDMTEECMEWIFCFSSEFFEIFKLDVASELGACGLAVLGDNCSRYMESESSPKPSPEKIKSKRLDVALRIPEAVVRAVDELVVGEEVTLPRWLRGHFLASGVQKFISQRARRLGRKASVAHEHLLRRLFSVWKVS